MAKFSPDGQRLLLFGRDQGQVWDAQTGWAPSLAFSVEVQDQLVIAFDDNGMMP